MLEDDDPELVAALTEIRDLRVRWLAHKSPLALTCALVVALELDRDAAISKSADAQWAAAEARGKELALRFGKGSR